MDNKKIAFEGVACLGKTTFVRQRNGKLLDYAEYHALFDVSKMNDDDLKLVRSAYSAWYL